MFHARAMSYVDEVARLGSIRAAGARLHIAPSAVNRQILMLEEQLGEPLFERLPRGMRPTPAGEILIAHIRRTRQQDHEIVAEMRALQSLPRGEVVIATMTGLASGVVASAAIGFQNRHPDVRISIRTKSSADMVADVVAGEAELGLGFNLPPSTQLDVRWQSGSRLGAVVSPDHPLSRARRTTLELCAEYPLVFADKAMLMHGITEQAFQREGLDAEPAFRTSSIEAMKRLAISGSAVAFLSRYDIAEELRDRRLVFVPVGEGAFADNVLSLVRSDRRGYGLAGRLFADEIEAALEAVRALE